MRMASHGSKMEENKKKKNSLLADNNFGLGSNHSVMLFEIMNKLYWNVSIYEGKRHQTTKVC